MRDEFAGAPSCYDEPRDMRIDCRPRIRPQELNERAVRALRPCGIGIERRQFLKQLALLSLREIASPDLVHEIGTPRVHDEGALSSQNVLERKMTLVRSASSGTDGTYGRMQHQCVACTNA